MRCELDRACVRLGVSHVSDSQSRHCPLIFSQIYLDMKTVPYKLSLIKRTVCMYERAIYRKSSMANVLSVRAMVGTKVRQERRLIMYSLQCSTEFRWGCNISADIGQNRCAAETFCLSTFWPKHRFCQIFETVFLSNTDALYHRTAKCLEH